MTRAPIIFACFLAGLSLLPACKSLNTSTERGAREHLEVASRERTELKNLRLPSAVEASQVDYVRYALLRHPAVYAAYAEWKASVAAIDAAKALPDPQLTFQADISGMLMSLMPGVMFDLMLPGKRAAMGREAAAAGEVAFRSYVVAASRVADGVNKRFVELAYLEEALRLKTKALALASQSRAFATAEYQTGAGMGAGSLESQLKGLNEEERIKAEVLSLQDQLQSEHARFKAALGLSPDLPDPDWPHPVLTRTPLPGREELWTRIQANNTDLARMRAMVEMTVAQEAQAGQARLPDFTAGIMADVKQAPWMWRPTATMTLPVWRGKLQGLLESSKFRREAAQASVDADVLNMSADLARMLFMTQEADRMIAFIDTHALPSLQRTRASTQAALQSGMAKASMLSEVSAMELAMLYERNAALRERELAVTDLTLMTALFARESGLVHLTP